MTVEDIIEVVRKDIPFFNTSGGGVTLSGGEPTMHMEFTSNLARSLKAMKIHLLLETCGLFVYEKFMETLDPFIDMIYFDIKLFDPAEHKKHCGADNEKILENFRRLYRNYQDGGTGILPRTPLIPGITDTEHNLTAIAEYLSSLGVTKAALLEYNPLWGAKCEKIGEVNPLGPGKSRDAWMDRDHVEKCRTIFRERGIEV
jgi:pyruvate formate lyase activating enzyme